MNIKFASSATLAVVSAAGLLTLGACSREADRATRAEAGAATTSVSVAAADEGGRPARADYQTSRSDGASRSADRDAEVRKSDDGKPMWASSRQRSGEDNAQKQFERNGQDFAASNLVDYVKKAHAFVDSPPKSAQTVSRPNGDVLYYDPKGNIFAVADREGAPRTMFKPRDGMSYWLQQKQRASDTSRSGSSSRYASRADRKDSASASDDQGAG